MSAGANCVSRFFWFVPGEFDLETKRALEYAVVLGPAIAVSFMMLAFNGLPLLKRWVIKVSLNRNVVKLAKEMIAHAAFYGAAIASLLGYRIGFLANGIAVVWFALATYIAYSLALQLGELERGEDHV